MSDRRSIPLSVPNIKGNEWKYVKDCLDTGWVSSAGKYVAAFERALARYVGARHAVACVNGTAGLHIALELCGVRPGDEVIVPTITFIAPVNAVRYCGAEPAFMDCDEFMNIDAEKLEAFCRRECRSSRGRLIDKKTGRTIKAVLPVHVFGNPCRMDLIAATARRFGLKIVEDATESLGSSYCAGPLKGRHTGTIGDFGVYSFNGNKIITTGGGGMIVTPSGAAAARAAYLTTQAKDEPVRFIHDDVGYNYRMNNLQAALGLAQLEQLDDFIETKKRNHQLYADILEGVPGVGLLGIPPGTSPNHWFYSLIVDEKEFGLSANALREKLGAAGIQTRPLWYPNHLQKPYLRAARYGIERALWFHKRVLNVPCSSDLKATDVRRVGAAIRDSGKTACKGSKR